MKENKLIEYSKELAISCEALCKDIDHIKEAFNFTRQLRKSSSSVYANFLEAQYPQSLADMLSKFKIARKECVETSGWLELLLASNYIEFEKFKALCNLCGRTQRLLTCSCKTIESKL